MLLSLDWLSDFVKVKYNSVKDFCEALTISGSKVEGYALRGAEIEGVIVGKIVKIEKHPDAEKLVVCHLDVGGEDLLKIVTGATNVFESAIVPVACHNARLPGGVKIKKSKLRGVLSEGMLCSLKELGLQACDFPYAREEGILIIEEDCEIGQDITSALKLDDTVVEFEITSNRPDCLSVVGLAREVAATYKTRLKEPQYNTEQEEFAKTLNAEVKEQKLCHRYMLHLVNNVNVCHSPLWVRARLVAAGVRPVNNVVDITNYVMIELGQPMHAFDADKVEGKICVRKAQNGEELTTLDGVKRKLDDSMLVIADEKKVLAIAGVMGGQSSEITSQTQNIILEAAVFDGTSVRQTAKKLGLRSESSARFEKGLPVYACPNAIARACELLAELGAAKDPKGAEIDIVNCQESPVKVKFDCQRINALLGTELSQEQMSDCLELLGFELQQGWVLAPVFRTDIENIADLAEEIARIFGYNNILSAALPGGGVPSPNPLLGFENKLANLAVSCGFYEEITYSMVSPKNFDKLLLSEDNPLRNCVKIKNPLGEDKSIMRTIVVPSVLESLARNFNQKNEAAYLFDLGSVYLQKDFTDENGPRVVDERPMLTLGAYDTSNKDADFFWFKGVVETILQEVGAKKAEFKKAATLEFMHPGRTATVAVGGQELGFVGQLHPVVAANYNLCKGVLVAQLDILKLKAVSELNKIYKPLSKYPAVQRDLALVCNKETPVAEVQDLIEAELGKELEETNLFDVYEGAQLPEGKKSVAFSLKLRSNSKTLEDEYVDQLIIKVLKKLEAKGIVLR